MRRLLWAFPLAVFLLNPNLACGVAQPEFHYGATEMRAAVEGDWTFTFTSADGSSTQVTLHLAQAPAPIASRLRGHGGHLIRSAEACGTRTLIKGAEACIDLTEMPLAVTYEAGDPSFAAPEARLSGNFTVYGLEFTGGTLRLGLEPLGSVELEVDLNADGSVRATRGPSVTVTVTVGRL